jgi:hypothetical protein
MTVKTPRKTMSEGRGLVVIFLFSGTGPRVRRVELTGRYCCLSPVHMWNFGYEKVNER